MKPWLGSIPLSLSVLLIGLPGPLTCQNPTEALLLRYRPQPQALQYEVNITTQSQAFDERNNHVGLMTSSHMLMNDMELRVEEAEINELFGRYVFGQVEIRTKTLSQGWSRTRYRDTTFRIKENGDVGQMGGRFRSSSGDQIFKRLWEIPHVLPEGPVEVGTNWMVNRNVSMEGTYSTDIETRYEVVEVLDGDVWVEFSGSVVEVDRGSAGRAGTRGNLSGRFGFRPSLGAMVGFEWDYRYRKGNWDRSWEYTLLNEEGSIVLKGLGEDLPMAGIDQAIERNKDNSKAFRHGLIVIGALAAAAIFLGAG